MEADLSSAKLRTGDGGGDGHVERLGSNASLGVVGDEELMSDVLARLAAYTVAFVAHDDDAVGRQRFLIYITSLEEGAVDGNSWRGGAYGGKVVGEVDVVDVDAGYGSHRGLYGLGTEGIGGADGAEYVTDAKPVGNADDGAQVAWVLYIIEGEAELPLGKVGGEHGLWQFEDGKHILRGLQETGLAQFVTRDLDNLVCLEVRMAVEPFGRGNNRATGEVGEQVAHYLGTLGNEGTLFSAPFFLLQGLDELEFVFA